MQGESNTGIVPFVWVSGLTVLGLILLIIVFFLLYQRKLFQQQEALRLIELRRQGEIMAAVIEGQENERKRMAHDLHDGVGALLTTIRMGLWALEKNFSPASARAEELRSWVDDAMENVRTVSRDLMPPTLERAGLADALDLLASRFAKSGEMEIQMEIEPGGKNNPPHTEIHLYRIIQELLNNSIKHGKAKQIRCRIYPEAATLKLHYEDNGTGFEIASGSNGLGLKNIESRVSLLQGKMQFDSAPGKGMRFELLVPFITKPE